jgi:hypothetical protein
MELEKLAEHATKSCRHCHGKGFTGYNINKDKHLLCRCVKRNIKAKAENEVAEEKLDGSANGFNRVEIGTIKRWREEIALLKKKHVEAENEVASHPLKEKLDETLAVAEEEQKAITAKVNTAKKRRELAAVKDVLHAKTLAEIVRLKAVAKKHAARSAELNKEAERMEHEAAKTEKESRSHGLQRALSQAKKRYNQQTHKVGKQGREALARVEKLQKKLDATYPGHEDVE